LATAEAELNNFDAARAALEEAEPIFTSLGAVTWVAISQLRRGRIALKQGDIRTAHELATLAANCFEQNGQQVNYATATLLLGQARLALGDFKEAMNAANNVLQIAQRLNVPSLRYASHLLLGQSQRFVRRPSVLSVVIKQQQPQLNALSVMTITLRAGFLEDKGEASRNLINSYLRAGRSEYTFNALERAKSQVLLNYVANREQFHWAQDDNHSQRLMKELNNLREEHQWFYRLAHEPPRDIERPNVIQPEQALAEVAVRERRIRSITEQLYFIAVMSTSQICEAIAKRYSAYAVTVRC
jgi:tetratricopeptide (TPR) repeat protein